MLITLALSSTASPNQLALQSIFRDHWNPTCSGHLGRQLDSFRLWQSLNRTLTKTWLSLPLSNLLIAFSLFKEVILCTKTIKFTVFASYITIALAGRYTTTSLQPICHSEWVKRFNGWKVGRGSVVSVWFSGTPGEIRTPDLVVRSHPLETALQHINTGIILLRTSPRILNF